MKISLVLATIDRSCEVERFLYHLKKQNYKNFELIVVDQNSDKKLEPILEPFKACFSIIHIKSCERGASRARNLGMQYINGDIIGFPDDDCWYAENLLEEVYRFFSQDTQWDGICGRAINEKEKTVVVRFSRREGHISRLNVWSRGVTFTMFFRSEVLDNVCCFDEELGVGAGTPWGSGEETDYLIRVVDASFKIFYNPGLTVYHPDPMEKRDELLHRAYSYGCGMGRVFRKHQYPLFFVHYYLFRSIGGIIQSLLDVDILKTRYFFLSLKGRVRGWLSEGSK